MEVMERRPNDDVAWKMGRIMLKYRPIAPKPLAAGTAPGVALEPIQAHGRPKKREGARRKDGGGKRGRKSWKVKAVDPSDASCPCGTAPVVTLPLMPVTPERKEEAKAMGSPTWSITAASPFFWPVLPVAGVVVSPRPVRAAVVSVTIENVTEVWSMGFCGNTTTDYVLRQWLEAGDCPAFFSKAADRVTWTNAAFRRMVVGGGSSSESPSSSSSYSSTSWSEAVSQPEASVEEDVRVVLVTRGLVPSDRCRAFTCMTNVSYACGRQGKVSLAVPCDVWRLEEGSLVWRLDVKAALRLSTGN